MDRGRGVTRRITLTCAIAALLALLAVPVAGARDRPRGDAAAALHFAPPAVIDRGAGPSTPAITAISCASRHACVGVDSTGDAVLLSGRLARSGGRTLYGADPVSGFTGVSCPSAKLCVGVDLAGRVLSTRRPGAEGAWKAVRLSGVADPTELSSITCPSAKLCVITDVNAGVRVATNPTGGRRAWREVVHGEGGSTRVACRSVRLCVAVTTTSSPRVAIVRRPARPSSWRFVPVRANPGGPIACPTTRTCIQVGRAHTGLGVLYTHHLGHGWHYARLPSAPNATTALACTSDRACLIGGRSGRVTRLRLPARGSVGAAVSTIAPGAADVGALACPLRGLCLAGDAGARLLATTAPAGGARWTVTHTIVVRAALLAVTCPSTTLCVAGDDAGAVLTSPGPAGPWTRHVIDAGHAIGAVTCLNATQCFAGDSIGRFLVTGAAGPAGPWQATKVPNRRAIESVSCPSATQCAVADAGGVSLSADPTAAAPRWTAIEVDAGTGETASPYVACPVVNTCAAAYFSVQTDASSEYFSAGVSTNPLDNDSWPDAPAVPGSGGRPNAISCTTALCVAASSAGQAATTTGGLTKPFRATTIDPGQSLTGVACTAAGRCVAVDAAGGVLASDAPQTSAWRRVATLRVGLDAIACPTSTACVAVDRYGRAAAGSA